MMVKTPGTCSTRIDRKTYCGEDFDHLGGALPKNLISPSPDVGSKGEWFRRPTLTFLGECRCNGMEKTTTAVQ